MEQKFHLFVRRHPGGGYTAAVLTHPHLASFDAELDAARADVAAVLARLLARDDGGLTRARTHWPDLKLRRVDVTVNALQHERMLPVPMRFSVVTHTETLPESDADLPLRKSVRARLWVQVPRLEASGWLADETQLDSYVQELVRHELYLAPVEQLLAAAYDGEESVETLTVAYRPRRTAAPSATRQRAALPPVPPALAETSRRLNDGVRAGLLERAFQRDTEVTHLLGLLSSERGGSALLVGPAGAGKTAVVHEAVARIAESEPGSALHGTEVYTTSGARIVAGMPYLGQWQQRLQRMLDALRARRAVLHLESVSELLAAGQGEQGLDVARYLLPAIESGEVTVVLEASPEELLRAERSHPALLHALRRVAVEPLSGEGAARALVSAAARVGRARGVRFTEGALARAVDLTERFGEGLALPGGAVNLLRAAAVGEEGDGPTPQGGSRAPARTVGADEVTQAFSRRTGYPREIVDPAVPLDPDAVLARLRERVVGQDAAMVLLRDLVVTLKTALSDPGRPLGSFLLLGPTGVGKTESALALAEYLFGDPKRMVRFDMSEYAAPGSASRLVSDYGGAEGPLSRRVREQPFGVVLLDEVEKADESVHDLLLQVLGEGRLTDAAGRTVSFRNTVVMLTSNLGADTAGRSLGFGDPGARRGAGAHYLAAATAFFRPELLNRFDHVVPYAPLSPETVRAIADRSVARALAREGLTRRGVRVRYDRAVVDRVAALGFDPNYGARPLNRAVERWVVAPLARVLAARGSRPPPELELIVRGEGIAVAPTSAPEVAALDAAALGDELARRAARLARSEVVLCVRPDGPHARMQAEWLADKLAAWARARGAEAEVLPGPGPAESTVKARGGAAAMLGFECGLHEFVTEAGAVRVWVREAGAAAQPEAARLYTEQPTPAALDVETGLEFVGAWDDALAGEALDRFVLARAAEG